ncbi:MAG TPA: hypothetical protein VGO47_14535 [Chlamydiales bacterium]|nr:hypothetical protein [Chlamydiales bacterium]
MLRAFIRGSKLRQWLLRHDAPDAIKECQKIFEKYYGVQGDHYVPFTETLIDEHCENDNINVEKMLPEELQKLLRKQRAVLHARVKYDGIFYATVSAHLGNSLIVFYPDGKLLLPLVVGCIEYIIREGTSVLLAVHRQRGMPATNIIDPFSKYPHFPAKIYLNDLESQLELVKLEWVAGHVARWTLSSEYVVILFLSRD